MEIKIAELLKKAIVDGVMPGAVVAVARLQKKHDDQIWFAAEGSTALCGEQSEVSTKTVFDLASLTKPLVTTLLTMILVSRGEVDLNSSTLSELLAGRKIPKDKRDITLAEILSHSGGFPAHRPYFATALTFRAAKRREWLLSQLLEEKLVYSPGTDHIYSDLGFMLLGMALEDIYRERLDRAYGNALLIPLGLTDFLGFDAEKLTGKGNIAATEPCPWTNRILQGEVHDDNCRVMGGICGHAGLFGTAMGVVKIGSMLVKTFNGWLDTTLFTKDVVKSFFKKSPGSSWAYGFDTPSPSGSSSGSHFSPISVGHLGFTGTSLWIDLVKGIVVVLLTNRVHPSRQNIRIRAFRPLLHDLVMESLSEVHDE